MRSFLLLGLLLAANGAPIPKEQLTLSPNMKPLLAGQLTWEVNHNFMTGTRQVELTMFSAFERDSACEYAVENNVKCPSKYNGAADVHGVLCVKMIKQDGDDTTILTPHLEGENGKLGACPYVWETYDRTRLSTSDIARCTDLAVTSAEALQQLYKDTINGQVKCRSNISPADNNGYPYNNPNIGIENNFQVLSIHSAGLQQLFDRKINKRDIVVGVKRLTVEVPDEATGVWAYLSAPDGSFIAYESGNVLKQCYVASNNSLCSFNTKGDANLDLHIGLKRDIANEWANPEFSQHKYWASFLETATVDKTALLAVPSDEDPPRSTRHIPLSQLSPTLETYVPLCSMASGSSAHCNNFPVNNYYSPGVGFPLLVEVAITPKAIANSGVGRTVFDGFKASTSPMLVKTFDNDGHAQSIYTPFNARGTMSNRTARCWNQDPAYAGSTWPTTVCESTDATINGRPCTVDAQCDGGVCTATWSYCRTSFDYDRNVYNRGGSLIKLDFDYMPRFVDSGLSTQVSDAGYDTAKDAFFTPYPENAGNAKPDRTFTQHMLNVVDSPFFDVDNPADNGVDAPRDHFSQSPSLFLSGVPVSPHHEASQVPGSVLFQHQQPAASAHLFATYACDAGSSNQPPIFIDAAEFALPAQDARGLTHETEALLAYTEHECVWNAPCIIDLYAADYSVDPAGAENDLSTDTIRIESAPGKAPETVYLAGSTSADCAGTGRIHCQWQVPHDFDGDSQTFFPSAIGKIITACFVALDVHPECSETESTGSLNGRTACTCRSLPYCIKIKILGRAPEWVEPTPMELNSRDDDGVIQPYRTDIPACEDRPITLTLAATDPDGDSVRIYVRDVDVDNDMFSGQNFPFRPDGGEGNADFFSPQLSQSWAGEAAFQQECGVFDGYGALREGNNENQSSIAPSPSETTLPRVVKSLNAPYDEAMQFVNSPSLSVLYTPSSTRKNGIDVLIRNSPGISGQQCSAAGGEGEANFVCREKRVNADQVICAYAYDNSRSVVHRWVGETNPNGDDIEMWRRDHSNGDLASQQWCWRIVMSAAPGFVTNYLGTSTPVSKAWLDSTYGSAATFQLTTRNEAAYRLTYLRVAEQHNDTFIAQDPNPNDDIEILVLEDPGIPRGMSIGRSRCMRRDSGSRPMCVAEDFIAEWSSPVGRVTSKCSKAQRTLSWSPLPEEGGNQYRLCMVAKDNSDSCVGISNDATSSGWFGETQCLVYDVVAPEIKWTDETLALLTDREIYVGCDNEIVFSAMDVSRTVLADKSLGGLDASSNGGGNYPVTVMVEDSPLTDAEYINSGSGIQSSLTVKWKAERTETGKQMKLCVVARDIYGMRSLGKRCVGGLHDGQVCGGMPNDCELDGGQCTALDSCVSMTVARCRYCAQPGESITSIMREFAMDNNWLRLWALNGNDNGANFPALKNPDLIAPGTTGSHLFLGVTYRLKPEETLAGIAARFRTTIKSILTLNYDIADVDAIQGGQEVCIVPCSNADDSVTDAGLAAARG